MLTFDLLMEDRIVILEPQGPLTSEDFEQLGSEVDQFIIQHGHLRGILIHTEEFPGWRDFAGLMSHVRFVREHRRKVERVALVSDSVVAALAPALGELFVGVEIERFDYDERDRALEWLRAGPEAGAPREGAPRDGGDG